MSAQVYSLDAARERPRSEVVSVNVRLDKNGDLVIREVRDDGVKLPAIVIADEHVDGVIAALAAARGRLRTKRFYAQHPEQRPKAEGKRACGRRRNGGRAVRGVRGCRRRIDHKGRCRDAAGDYTPAICLHVGRPTTRIVTDDGTFLQCAFCGVTVSK